MTAKEYTSTHLAESENNFSLLFWFKGYRNNPQVGQEKSELNWSRTGILSTYL